MCRKATSIYEKRWQFRVVLLKIYVFLQKNPLSLFCDQKSLAKPNKRKQKPSIIYETCSLFQHLKHSHLWHKLNKWHLVFFNMKWFLCLENLNAALETWYRLIRIDCALSSQTDADVKGNLEAKKNRSSISFAIYFRIALLATRARGCLKFQSVQKSVDQ